VQFLHSTSDLRLAWVVAGFGLRLAQDIGFHRHKFSDPISIDEELEKRAFWQVYTLLGLAQPTHLSTRTLLYLDTQLSGALGRSAVHDPIEYVLIFGFVFLALFVDLPAAWISPCLASPTTNLGVAGALVHSLRTNYLQWHFSPPS
jgi:hypothetical protein